jgi:hypothetical protein
MGLLLQALATREFSSNCFRDNDSKTLHVVKGRIKIRHLAYSFVNVGYIHLAEKIGSNGGLLP